MVNRLYTRFRNGTRGVFVFIAFFSYLPLLFSFPPQAISSQQFLIRRTVRFPDVSTVAAFFVSRSARLELENSSRKVEVANPAD